MVAEDNGAANANRDVIDNWEKWSVVSMPGTVRLGFTNKMSLSLC